MNNDLLGVWYGSRRVGLLRRRPFRTMAFRYDPAWLREDGFEISQSMPFDHGDSTVRDERAHRFFANLLPEGAARARIVRRHRIPDVDFDLLRAFGGECAGALLILPEDQQPDSVGSQDYEHVDHEMLASLLFQQGYARATDRDNRAPRLSLAGAQNKMPVAVVDGLICLPRGTAPSTHILKFDSLEYSNVLAYESFATMLAKSAGLTVVEFELRRFEQDFFALVQRYDRVHSDGGRILRLHQEDFCQALGCSFRTKYESDGGPTFVRCFELVRELSDAPLDDLESLLRWQIFDVLAGNSDGHAKNLSLLYGADRSTRLAPFYDLVPTRAVQNLDHELALKVGGMGNPGNVGPNHWKSLAVECDIPSRVVFDLVEGMAESLTANIWQVRERFDDLHGPFPALDRVERVVRRQCRAAIRGLSQHAFSGRGADARHPRPRVRNQAQENAAPFTNGM